MRASRSSAKAAHVRRVPAVRRRDDGALHAHPLRHADGARVQDLHRDAHPGGCEAGGVRRSGQFAGNMDRHDGLEAAPLGRQVGLFKLSG